MQVTNHRKDIFMGKDLLELGKVVAIHALKGEFRLQPWCDTPDFAAGFQKV